MDEDPKIYSHDEWKRLQQEQEDDQLRREIAEDRARRRPSVVPPAAIDPADGVDIQSPGAGVVVVVI